MAYPGQKSDRMAELRSLDIPARSIVDAFYGSGGLTKAYTEAYPEDYRFLIAGEAFTPLRTLYCSKIDLRSLAQSFIADVERRSALVVWEDLRDGLEHRSLSYSDAESFLILNNVGHGNSMRHNSSGRHNIKFADDKFDNLKKRGSLIDPIVFRPTSVCPSWQSALMEAQGSEAVALLDPPYLRSGAIYPKENPAACAVPPVLLAMKRRYGAIVAYNSPDDGLHQMFDREAKRWGYSIDRVSTQWKTKFSAKSKSKSEKEALWIFRNANQNPIGTPP